LAALEPSKALFSYFPADRALPIGDQPVQLGLADANAQLESYNSQPQTKFNRLKQTIFTSIVRSEEDRHDLTTHFSNLFERILRGPALGQIGINPIGMLSIPIVDKDTGATFDIDGLSSGEKGLILTFLLIAKSVAENGLIWLDEPELHLNPAVCRDLVQFLVDEYATKRNLQVIICSHSAELLAGAFDRPNCALCHLRGNRSLTKVRVHDQGEIRDALRRLGSSESEALLYKGTISVEGIHDVEILQSGFDDILRRYRIKPVITGHLDFLQVRNGAVHILDYKPDATTNKPIAQLAVYALALTRLVPGLRLFDIKCAWFNEQEYCEFFPRTLFTK
jgi:hypothetical protein